MMPAPEKYQRSDNYRSKYIAKHPGLFHELYLCAYCGKIVRKKHMEVDHVVPVDAALKHKFVRIILPKGVNDTSNLVSACHSCNSRKSNRGGLWIIRGLTGRFIQPLIWIALLIALGCFVYYIATGGITKESAVAYNASFFRTLGNYLLKPIQWLISWIEEIFIRFGIIVHQLFS